MVTPLGLLLIATCSAELMISDNVTRRFGKGWRTLWGNCLPPENSSTTISTLPGLSRADAGTRSEPQPSREGAQEPSTSKANPGPAEPHQAKVGTPSPPEGTSPSSWFWWRSTGPDEEIYAKRGGKARAPDASPQPNTTWLPFLAWDISLATGLRWFSTYEEVGSCAVEGGWILYLLDASGKTAFGHFWLLVAWSFMGLAGLITMGA